MSNIRDDGKSGNAWEPDTLRVYSERPDHPASTDPAWDEYRRKMEALRARNGRQKRRGKVIPPPPEFEGK